MDPKVILTGFADEGPVSKNVEAQLAMCRGLGLSWYSPRFVNFGSGAKNLMAATEDELGQLRALHDEFEMQASSIGSPIGKVKLLDVDDGTTNRYVPFDEYLATEVAHAIHVAQSLDCKLIRGFSFYPPRGDDPMAHVERAAEQLRPIAEACAAAGIYFGLEVEANLVGRDGRTEAALYEAVGHEHLVLIFDGANIACQGYRQHEVYAEYEAMREGIGWLHIKDYDLGPNDTFQGYVDEEMLRKFVPCDRGASGHAQIFADFRQRLPKLTEWWRARGVPGVFMDLEPHLRGGGQFGGFSGADGFGVALRALCGVLDATGIGYDLTVYSDLHKV
ncbi:MAG TPA: hypothetical protein DCZ72_03980 [Armatimonadetes bacterium]|nr:hypothetical protein [Armatimonadota bacterium]